MQPPLPPPPGAPGTAPSAFLPRRGRRFAVGDDGSSWLVWDLTSGIGSPVSVHPRTPDGYSAALRRFYELETAVHPPFFRRTGGGWVMLNVLIGVVLSFGLFFLEAVGAVSIHEEILDGPQEPSDGAYSGALLVSIVAGLLGWLLFCYLRSPLSRGLWLAVTYVAAFAAGVVMLASSVN